MAGRADSGTQFEAPRSRPTSAEGKIIVPKKFIPARSKSTEPMLTVEVVEASLSRSLKSSDVRKGGSISGNSDGENAGEQSHEGSAVCPCCVLTLPVRFQRPEVSFVERRAKDFVRSFALSPSAAKSLFAIAPHQSCQIDKIDCPDSSSRRCRVNT